MARVGDQRGREPIGMGAGVATMILSSWHRMAGWLAVLAITVAAWFLVAVLLVRAL